MAPAPHPIHSREAFEPLECLDEGFRVAGLEVTNYPIDLHRVVKSGRSFAGGQQLFGHVLLFHEIHRIISPTKLHCNNEMLQPFCRQTKKCYKMLQQLRMSSWPSMLNKLEPIKQLACRCVTLPRSTA